MPGKILVGFLDAANAASLQNAVPRHGVLAYDRPPRKCFRHTFLLLRILFYFYIISAW